MDSLIRYFNTDSIKGITIPPKFTYPFYYTPHPLAILAAQKLQHFLEFEFSDEHNFGLDPQSTGLPIGKMFGVLVVKDMEGKLGYLFGFSGKLAGRNHHNGFVPPVFDMLDEKGFFIQEEKNINQLNTQIEELLQSKEYQDLKSLLISQTNESSTAIQSLKEQLKSNKQERAHKRLVAQKELSPEEFTQLDQQLIQQSLYDKRLLRDLNAFWSHKLGELKESIQVWENKIDALKNERKQRSAALQKKLFEQYTFLNSLGKEKSLEDIFKSTPLGTPPAAAGECSLPKLLQYAFLHQYQPIAMAEFWWGASPKSEIRKHQQFYPSCTGKCKPILTHMLEGMEVEENPLLQVDTAKGNLEIVFEDDQLIVVNKPAGLRSVPGVHIEDSVYSRIKKHLGNSEPLMIHRLDMETSGLLVIAKTTYAHRFIQKQFLNRIVKKRYSAVLDKPITHTQGRIELPLAPDYINSPRQMVCFETGKPSVTDWKLIENRVDSALVHFWPHTGRTHQLRMHAAHEDGLNTPIKGDDLYGKPSDRMYLHAAEIRFTHPISKTEMHFEVEECF